MWLQSAECRVHKGVISGAVQTATSPDCIEITRNNLMRRCILQKQRGNLSVALCYCGSPDDFCDQWRIAISAPRGYNVCIGLWPICQVFGIVSAILQIYFVATFLHEFIFLWSLISLNLLQGVYKDRTKSKLWPNQFRLYCIICMNTNCTFLSSNFDQILRFLQRIN